jgi:hypothetical protein
LKYKERLQKLHSFIVYENGHEDEYKSGYEYEYEDMKKTSAPGPS